MYYYKRLFTYAIRMGFKLLRINNSTIQSYAVDSAVVCAKEEGVQRPAVTLAGETEKATGNYFGDLEKYIEYATMITASHSATEVYRVENVIYDNGYLYKNFVAEHVSSLGRPTKVAVTNVENMFLCSTPSGSRYFGDWLVADNLRELLAKEMNIKPLKIRPHTSYEHLPEINKLLNLDEQYSEGVIHIKNLYMTADKGYNENKRQRCEKLRSSLRENIKGKSESSMVYISRGEKYSAGRGLTNEADVIKYLLGKGFLILDPTRSSAHEILQQILNCSIVIGIEGSQLAYGFLALKKGGVMLTLQPPYHFQSAFRPRCDAVGVRWGFIVGDEEPNGFSVNIEDIDKILEANAE